MKYLDIDSDEAEEIIEAYREARAQVDEQYPRGEKQVNYIRTIPYRNWHDAHFFWFLGEQELSLLNGSMTRIISNPRKYV